MEPVTVEEIVERGEYNIKTYVSENSPKCGIGLLRNKQ